MLKHFFCWISIQLILSYSIFVVNSHSTSFEEAIESLKFSKNYADDTLKFLRRLKRSSVVQANGSSYNNTSYVEPNYDDDDDFGDFYFGPVCEVIDVSLYPSSFSLLENCAVINGYLQIKFINDDEKQEKADLSRLKFPKLRVITEYLLIYRVFGLVSLRKMFPNLSVIGGRKLFGSYAMTIFDNPDLIELGLGRLKFIQNGGVRIEKNNNLCYLDSINWNLLGQAFSNDVEKKSIIRNNNFDGCFNQCNSTCKIRNQDGVSQSYCFGANLCQAKPCPKSCEKACSTDFSCDCHEECLDGCSSSNNASACFACRNFYLNHTCVKKCPAKTLLLENICISLDYCQETLQSIVHEDKCLITCPQNHKETHLNKIRRCERCDGKCTKVCEPSGGKSHVVDNRNSLASIQDCTEFDGQLIINIKIANLEQDLENSFRDLEIVGAIVVQHTRYLKSLSFLNNLKRITGNPLYSGNNEDGYSVYILDNHELGDLWSVSPDFVIEKGKSFFHFNPYLCLNKINKIENLTKEVEDPHDISLTTNGDRVTCVMDTIENVTYEFFHIFHHENSVTIRISWKIPYIQDPRTLIGFNIYYKKIDQDHPNVKYDPSDKNSWEIEYVDKNDVNNNSTNTIAKSLLNGLEFFTNYSFFITTYTTESAKKGARSDIHKFRTKAGKPSLPQSITLKALNHSAILARWEGPKFSNGHIVYYILRYKPRKLPHILGDICHEKTQLQYQKPIEGKDVPEVGPPDNSKNCKCKGEVDTENIAEEAQNSAVFEDYIINTLIQRVPDQSFSRKKRSSFSVWNLNKRSLSNMNRTETNNTLASEPELDKSVMIEIPAHEKEYIITNLTHFTEYQVSIQVCNHMFETLGCSNMQVGSRRTKMLRGSDAITSDVNATVLPQNDLFVKFKPPKAPNGFILYYEIDFKKPDVKNACCSAKDFEKEGGCSVKDLDPGKYEHAYVVARSLADFGKESKEFVFEIKETEKQSMTLTIVLTVLALVIIPAALIIFFYFKYKSSKQPPIYASVNPDYSSVGVYEPDEYEVDEDKIKLIKEIGQGHFGKVYEGVAQEIVYGQQETKVAVKTMHGNENPSKRSDFLKEATVMKAFNSYHVVRLLGVVSRSIRPMMVMEYMENGDLKNYLRSVRPDAELRRGEVPTLAQKLQMCGEIADGMAYLAERKFVHRDLAARNCLVHESMTVKIGDFGLTRDVYETDYYRIDSRGILPVRWMAPESLKDGVFDSRSDVWSYGIVLWEIANLAEQPYQGRQHKEVTQLVIDGGYMEQPKDCPKKLYDLMLMCWQYSPSMRPSFLEIVQQLLPDLNDQFKQNSFFSEQLEASQENEVDDLPYVNGSQYSATQGLLSSNGSGDRSDSNFPDNGFRHLNGGRQARDGQGDVPFGTDTDQETVRYVTHPLMSRSLATSNI